MLPNPDEQYDREKGRPRSAHDRPLKSEAIEQFRKEFVLGETGSVSIQKRRRDAETLEMAASDTKMPFGVRCTGCEKMLFENHRPSLMVDKMALLGILPFIRRRKGIDGHVADVWKAVKLSFYSVLIYVSFTLFSGFPQPHWSEYVTDRVYSQMFPVIFLTAFALGFFFSLKIFQPSNTLSLADKQVANIRKYYEKGGDSHESVEMNLTWMIYKSVQRHLLVSKSGQDPSDSRSSLHFSMRLPGLSLDAEDFDDERNEAKAKENLFHLTNEMIYLAPVMVRSAFTVTALYEEVLRAHISDQDTLIRNMATYKLDLDYLHTKQEHDNETPWQRYVEWQKKMQNENDRDVKREMLKEGYARGNLAVESALARLSTFHPSPVSESFRHAVQRYQLSQQYGAASGGMCMYIV